MRESPSSTPPVEVPDPFWFEQPAPPRRTVSAPRPQPAPVEPVIAEPVIAEPVIAEPVIAKPATIKPTPPSPAIPAIALTPTVALTSTATAVRPVVHVDPAALVARFDAIMAGPAVKVAGLGEQPATGGGAGPMTGPSTAEFTVGWKAAWSRELADAQDRRPRRARRIAAHVGRALLVLVVLAVGASAWFVTHRPRTVVARPEVLANQTTVTTELSTALGGHVAAHSPASAYALRTVPGSWLRMYWKAADEYGLDWAVLAAVGTIESDNGQSRMAGVSTGTNSAGAAGPAQFLTGTWARYGVNVDDSNGSSPYDPADAITTMAAYLKASGAPQNYTEALFAYNHSVAYGDAVLALAAKYRR